MSLTRAQWIEMWGNVKLLESHGTMLRELLPYLSPYRRHQLKGLINVHNQMTNQMKDQIQSVIGQME